MERIRVVHIINAMEIGGAQTQAANLFAFLNRERFDLRLICLAQKGALGEQLERAGFPVEALGKNARVQPGMLRRLVRILREWRPHIVHCSVFTANLWGRIAGILAGVPILIAHEQSTVSLEKRHRRLMDRVLSWKTWRVLTVSEDLRRRVIAEEGIAARRVETLYNAIDARAFENDAPPPADLPGRPGRRVGIVGRLEYRKDHLTLIRAAGRVVREEPETVFLLAGEGPERPELEAEIARLKLEEHVFLLGERRDVPQLLRGLDLYVLSSITEGLSLSILEAMAAGCPVVATRVGGNPELLDEGRAGVLTPPGDDASMAAAVLRLLQEAEERKKLAENARRRARDLFDIRAVARRLETLYETAVREQTGAAPAE